MDSVCVWAPLSLRSGCLLWAAEMFVALDVDQSGGLSKAELRAFNDDNLTDIFIERGTAKACLSLWRLCQCVTVRLCDCVAAGKGKARVGVGIFISHPRVVCRCSVLGALSSPGAQVPTVMHPLCSWLRSV